MNDSRTKSLPALGFLTVLEHPHHGLFGGYLVLNAAGRPVEFHCTAPLKPNRAQEILYGPTLTAFLYGEQIGQTLLAQSRHEPLLVCTDQVPVLAVRDFVTLPVALVLSPLPAVASDPSDASEDRTARGASPALTVFTIGQNRLAVPTRRDDDRQAITQRLTNPDELFDLSEPFERIRAAIEEAQRAAA